MATFTLEPVSFDAPSATRHGMKVGFRAPANSSSSGRSNNSNNRSPIHPATALQFSFRNECNEVFVERLTPRDIAEDEEDEGLYLVRLPASQIPRFKPHAHAHSQTDFDVFMHAWRGEKLLGSWVVGTIPWTAMAAN